METKKSKNIVDQELDTQYEERNLYEINIGELHPDPKQPRKSFDETDLQELQDSILKHGVLQPVLFRQDDDGKLIIVAGERRYKASKLAGCMTVPAIFTTGNAAEIALVENMLRVNLTPLEEAEGLERLKIDAGYKNVDIASVIGKAESTISEILSLNRLCGSIKEIVKTSKDFSRRQLIEVAKGKNPNEQMKLFKTLLNNTSKRQLREKPEKNEVETLVKAINNLGKKLQNIDLDSLDDEVHNDIRVQLTKLVKSIQEKLN